MGKSSDVFPGHDVGGAKHDVLDVVDGLDLVVVVGVEVDFLFEVF